MKLRGLKKSVSSAAIAVAILATSNAIVAQSQSVAKTDPSLQNVSEAKPELKPNVAPATEVKSEPNQDPSVAVKADGEITSPDVKKPFYKLREDTAAGTSKNNAETAESGKQPDPNDKGWHVAFAPYLYMTGFSGTIGARGRTVEVDASFGSVLENLSFGLMGTLEARKGKFIIFNDMIWNKLGVERDTPGPLYNTARVDVNLFIFDPEVGYRVYESEGGSFDVLGGVRLWSVENSLETTTGTLTGFNVSERKTWVAFVGGFHGVANLTPRFFLSTKFDIGAGSGTDITTQFYGGAGFRIKPKAALIGGYRFLKVDHDDNSGFVFNTNMNGFVLGAKFTF